jgi:hypothetical protein
MAVRFNDGNNADAICPICRDPLIGEEVVSHNVPNTSERVAHVFHAACMTEWHRHQRGLDVLPGCPLCNRSIEEITQEEESARQEQEGARLRQVCIQGIGVKLAVMSVILYGLHPSTEFSFPVRLTIQVLAWTVADYVGQYIAELVIPGLKEAVNDGELFHKLTR